MSALSFQNPKEPQTVIHPKHSSRTISEYTYNVREMSYVTCNPRRIVSKDLNVRCYGLSTANAP